MSTMELAGHTDSVVSVGFNASGKQPQCQQQQQQPAPPGSSQPGLHASKRRALCHVETHRAVCGYGVLTPTQQVPTVQAVGASMHAVQGC